MRLPGIPAADEALRRLLLDPEDTAVTVAAAKRLLFMNTPEALRHFLWAWGRASLPTPQEPIDDLYGAYSHWAYELATRGPEAEAAFAQAVASHLGDEDPYVAEGARTFLADP